MKLSVALVLVGVFVTITLADPQHFLRGRKIPNRGRIREQPSPVSNAIVVPSTPSPPPKKVLTRCDEKGCPAGFNAFNGKCYKVQKFNAPVTIEQAQRKCQAEKSTLASDNSVAVHRYLIRLLKPYFNEEVDSKYRRAFIGLMCRDGCDTPGNWVYADGNKCNANSFCDWSLTSGPNSQWNSEPTALYGATLAAILDDAADTNYNHKLQSYPADHQLQFGVCQKEADNTDHLKPKNLMVSERVTNVLLTWDRPQCAGTVSNYIFVLLGGAISYDTEIKCAQKSCSYELNPEVCNHCIHPNTEYSFSIAAVLQNSQLGPAISINKQIDVETCPNFETPFHTVSTCRGVSELVQDGSCEPKVTWSKGSMCGVLCETGYGFFEQPAPKYSCDNGGLWAPAGKAPECYEIVPVYSANLQFKITYKRPNIENLRHQFDGLVYKYNDIFCPYPEECGIGDIQIKSALDSQGKKLSEVTITIDTPVYNITDQAGFIGLVREAVNTVNEDNAFMTLIDYDNIELVLPQTTHSKFKANPMLCCHSCPEGHAYKLGNCVRCPAGGTCA